MENKLSAPLDEFKEREIEIINLMAEGLSNQEIADQLFITKETVRWYNKQIYSKLGTSRRTEAIALAREIGFISGHEIKQTTTPSIQNKLPTTTGPFIGRERELLELSDLLHKPEVRLLSLIATGGMGKSRLSLELGHLLKGNYEHGVAFIELSTIRDSDDIAKVAVSSLGLTISDKQNPHNILLNYCREKELLLIFDNFEHVLSGAKLLTDILKDAPGVTIIATSRERLNLRVETVVYLQPVMSNGVKLFTELASMMRPDIDLSDVENTDIQRIVDLVGGLPLGLILAANWVDILSVQEIATEIETNLNFLGAEMGDMPERQQSIHAVINPTWNRLNPQEQKAFMFASVFRGGFTHEAFQSVTGTSIRTLQSLLNRSLISHGLARRYDLHPLLRQYAREKLQDHILLADAKNAHLQTFMIYAQTHAERMLSGHYLESLDALDFESDNIRAALDWSLQGNNIDQGVALILANGDFWLIRSRVLEATTYLEKAIQQSDDPKLLYWQSVYLDRLGQIDRSVDAARQIIAYAEANQDWEMLAQGQFRLGVMQNASDAKPLFEQALSNALKTGNQHLIAYCHHYLSFFDSQQFPIDDTRSHIQQSLKIFESLGDLHGISRVTNNIAISYYDLDRVSEAKELMDYSLQLKRKIGDRAGEARRFTTLSMWAINEEELVQAQEWLLESRKICEELGELERLSYVLSTEGLLYLLLMDLESAQATLERNLQLDIDIQDYRGVVDVYSLLCLLHIWQNNPTDAHLSLQKALDFTEYSQLPSTMLIVSYANYLWYEQKLDVCVPIVAVLSSQGLHTYVGSNMLINKYFLQPLIYRIQQHIGDDAWQHALDAVSEITTEQIFQKVVDELQQK